ncbi:MAG: aminotransferase class I/II-fold pyridoxal phosphate-dependent enzyme [Lachnospiraceae bacterium]|jgi:LL-diaminopimelate aminotransferase|nr:aminotransferase class I/II-fold pyridoxal phosphate-dependent enzyme [Lachnospiraceae bacterium]
MVYADRLNNLGEGIFSKLLEIKRRRIACGERVIDLSVGTPNIPPAPHVVETLCKAASDGKNYVYAISDQEELLGAVAAWYDRRFGVKTDPDTQICSLLGSQEGLAHIALTLANEGDVVLVPDPCYPVFADGGTIAGAKLHYMPMKRDNGYLIRFDDIPADAARRAKLMVVSYPNNPTTAMAGDAFYRELVAFAKEFDIAVLHDNAYSELVFDGRECGSFLAYPGAMDVGVEFNSLSKSYGLAGARIGFCLGNGDLVRGMKKLKSNMDYGMFLPFQKAAIAAISGPQECVAATRRAYEGRRDVLCEGFSSIGWPMEKPQATMFVWAKIPEAYLHRCAADGSGASGAGGDESAGAAKSLSMRFSLELIEKAGVMVTPGNAFGPSGEGYVRLALVQDADAIRDAVEAVRASGVF